MDFEKIEHYQRTLKELELQYWLENSLFTPAWWMLLVATFIPWLIWFKFVDRSRFLEIALFGFLWGVLAIVLDEISSTWVLWAYPRKLFPTIPPLIPADLTIIPVAFMFVYQKVKSFKEYILWSTVTSAVFSFVIEVIFVKLNLFKMYNWEHWYSFIGFLVVAAFAWWLHQKMLKIAKVR